jgi:hypothetical protein
MFSDVASHAETLNSRLLAVAVPSLSMLSMEIFNRRGTPPGAPTKRP